MKITAILLVISIYFMKKSTQVQRCQNFGYDSVACVCDEKYCDNVNPRLPEVGEYLFVTSNKEGLRFETSYGSIFQNNKIIAYRCTDILTDDSVILVTNRTKTAQKIIGFGGAITDAVGINLNKVPRGLQNQILVSYFSSEGLNYNMARTTIGHSDYSESLYYYNDCDYDFEMKNWTLAEADLKNKIPFILRAQEMVGEDFLLLSSIWTVPYWMRENSDEDLRLLVSKEYYYSYCLYIIKFLEAYREQGIEFWGVSFANEPFIMTNVPITEDIVEIFTVWTVKRYADFALNHFIPALAQDFSDVKVIFFEENRVSLLRTYTDYIRKFTNLNKYMEIVGIHSYLNDCISPDVVDRFLESFPNVTIINSEFAAGLFTGLKLGSWSTAEFYAGNMLQELNHFFCGWVDWNLLLDTNSGPKLVGDFSTSIDAPIILDVANKVFYKQPSYYAIGHFSKFMPPGSKKIELTPKFLTELLSVGVMRPDGRIAAVLLNQSNKTICTTIEDTKGNIQVTLSPNSVSTLIF